MVARSLLDTLREVCDDERDCVAVLERISRLADDSGTCLCRESEFTISGRDSFTKFVFLKLTGKASVISDIFKRFPK